MQSDMTPIEMIITDAHEPTPGSLSVELSRCANGEGAGRPGMRVSTLRDYMELNGQQWASLAAVLGLPVEGPVDMAALIGQRVMVRISDGWQVSYLQRMPTAA